jgi:outer membrane protein OmpA-like peptidoglycan-associated protein
MSSTLIDAVKSVFTDVLISKFATLLGETEGNVQKAVRAAIPVVLTGVLHKAATTEGASNIWNLSKQAAGSDFFGQLHELSAGPGGLVAGSTLLNKSTDFTRRLLTDRTDPVIKEVSQYAVVSVPSATFITGVVSFASLDSMGRHIINSHVDATGLKQWLEAQRDSIIHAIPDGLQVKTALGINHYPGEKVAGVKRNTALYVVVGLLVVILVVFFIYRSRKQSEAVTYAGATDTLLVTHATPTTAPGSATSTTDTVQASAIQVTLPNGQVLDAYQGGTEDRLVAFLNDHHRRLDKKWGNWFDFTKVGFASNSSSLLLESEVQLKNIVAILGAFPKARIKIGGYSDNTGDSTDNVRLSQQRADNILAKLKDLGAKSSQLTGAEGYGPNYPVGDNGTAAGRASNRRMSVDVKAA